MTVQQVLARISKLCKNNLDVYSEDNYQPKWPSGTLIKGARKEADGAIDSYKEILNEIRKIRLELRKTKQGESK